MAEKHDLSEKKIRLSRAVCATPAASTLKAKKLKFRLPESFGLT
jgi:hypothetical protein